MPDDSRLGDEIFTGRNIAALTEVFLHDFVVCLDLYE